jgi:hypothetical protein
MGCRPLVVVESVVVKRRYFVLAGVAAALGAVGWRYLTSKDEEAIIAVLEKRLHYLNMDPSGLKKFARDLAGSHSVASGRLHVLTAAGILYTRPSFDGHNFLTDGIRHGEERIVTHYLLSSDFFQNGADETEVVQYIAAYDPVRACGNPFARLAQG